MKKEDFLLGTEAEKLVVAKRFLAAERLANEFLKATLAAEIERLTSIIEAPGGNPGGKEADLRSSLHLRYKDVERSALRIQALAALRNLAKRLAPFN